MARVSLDIPELTRYLRYDELVALLRSWSEQYPRWCRLSVIGHSAEGRELLLATVGDHESDHLGGPDRRPAIWIDGNHHAGEVIGSTVALATIWSLIRRAEAGDSALSETTWYVQPRVAVDGTEVYLTTPYRLRSAAIDYPSTTPAAGLHPADIDGDGWILQMRVLDENGEWRISGRDRRLMVRRNDEDDPNETYYRLYPEGEVLGESIPLQIAPTRWALDFNRTYPHNWQPEYRQSGAGPYPLYPAETRANVEFILGHPNIGIVVSYHTHGGFAFRLPSSVPRSAYRHGDLTGDYQVLCDRFAEITGGPVIQSYDEAAQTARFGSLMDWAYNQHGIYGWVPELWDVWLAAGIDRRGDPSTFFAPRDEDEQAALLAWNDAALGGAGFRDWRPFDHPVLGAVEIGGWMFKYTHQNPPGHLVPPIAEAHIAWTDHLATTLPRLQIEEVRVEPVADGIHRLSATITNRSFLPTNISEQAIVVRRADPVHVELTLERGEVLEGSSRDIEHLAGRGTAAHRIWEDPKPSKNRAVVSWLVRGRPAGAVRAWSAKAGVVEARINGAG